MEITKGAGHAGESRGCEELPSIPKAMAFGSSLCLYLWEENSCARACSLEETDIEEVPKESISNFRSYSKSYSKFGFTIHNIALIVMGSFSIFNDGDE